MSATVTMATPALTTGVVTNTPSKTVYRYAPGNLVLANPVDEAYLKTFGFATVASPLMHSRVTLTAASILALNTTPIIVVPAPAANQIISLVRAIATLTYNSAAYVLPGGAPFLAYALAPTVSLGGLQAALFTTAASTTNNWGMSAAGVAVPLASALGSAVVFTAAGNPTTGNSIVDIDVWYNLSTQ